MTTSIYLAHLNPVTKAHVKIIKELQDESQEVRVMPVIFEKDKKEINSRSFPFNFEIRKKMLDSVFGNSISVLRNYTFKAPFCKYLPPFLSPLSWKLRERIIDEIRDDYFTYTGDKAEAYMLKIYRLNPKIGKRKSVSAASVKNKLYESALGLSSNWQDDVPVEVEKVILNNWDIIEKFAKIEDRTTRVAGMKFPKDGYWSK